MCEFVAQIPSSRDVKQNFKHSKLKPYTVEILAETICLGQQNYHLVY